MPKIIREDGSDILISVGGETHRIRVGLTDPNGTAVAGAGTYYLRLDSVTPGVYMCAGGTVWSTRPGDVVVLSYALSDAATTDLVADTDVVSIRVPHGFSLQRVRAYLHKDYPSTSGPVQVDINNAAGTSVLSTKLVIDQDETTSVTAVQPVLTTTPLVLADDAVLSFDIDLAGTGAKGLVVQLIGRPT